MKTTIRQVAELAGVSITTVSHVLNNKEGTRVRQDTQRRVQEAAKKLSYHVAGAARPCSVKRAGNLGLVVPAEGRCSIIELDVFAGVIGHICRTAAESGYGVLVEPAEVSEGGSYNLPGFVRDGKVDGCLVLGVEGAGVEALVTRMNATVPVVCVDREHPEVDCVVRDNFRGALVATSHLVGAGCRSVVCLCPAGNDGEPVHSIYGERVDGFVLALARSGVDAACSYVVMVPDEGSAGVMARLLLSGNRPDGVVALSRRAAETFLGISEALGLLGTMRVATFRDSSVHDASACAVPHQVGEVRIDSSSAAQNAVKLLANRIAGNVVGSLRVVVKAEFVPCADEGSVDSLPA